MNANGYRRVVLKVSGESLISEHGWFDVEKGKLVAEDVAAIREMGIDVIVVVGGGNLFRGPIHGRAFGLEPAEADDLGMLATGMNAQALVGSLRHMGQPSAVFSRGSCASLGHPWDRDAVCAALRQGTVVVLAGGMGIGGVSSDMPAVHGAIELDADAVIMAKHGVEGLHAADPHLVPDAPMLASINASEAIARRLAIMDLVALDMALEHGKPIHIVGAAVRKAVRRLLEGEDIGSVIVPS